MAEFLKRLDPSLAILLIEHDMDVVFDVVTSISVLHFGAMVERTVRAHQEKRARAADLPRTG